MKTYLIDLDGTMYHGSTINEGAKEFIDYLVENNYEFYFCTNNARRTLKQNVEHMEKMGFTNISEKHFFTSAIAAAMHIAESSDKRNAYYIGEAGLEEALKNYHFNICNQDVDFVFIGLDINADYNTYSKALSHLVKGAKLVGTNVDRKLPKDDGFNVGNGAIVAMFEYASGQKSEPLGKPYKVYMDCALKYINKSNDEVVILGDNLETDILCGINADVETIFYTGGVHQKKDIDRLKVKPTKTIDSLFELIKNKP